MSAAAEDIRTLLYRYAEAIDAGHLEDAASIGTMAALAAAREAKPGARFVVCSEHAHSS